MESPVQRLAACVIAALLFVLLGAPSSQASTSQATSLRYVALGDSYSAASGVLPPDPTAHPMCLRSTSNYPHLIAAATGAQLTDVTCGGADTGDYYAPQYDGVPPQLDAVTADAELVTMTIGGNDSGVFIDSIVRCGMAGASTGGQGSPCKDRYGSSFQDTIRTTTYPALVKALGAVRAAAPDAEVAILGYPWIMPKTGGCFDRMPVAEGDVPYVRGIQATLNDAVRRAAAATGATYVNMNKVSEGHDACQPLGVRWIEPVLQGTNAVVVHPNALGEEQMAARAMQVLGLS
jgi:lysophospholipase L1-like esterase